MFFLCRNRLRKKRSGPWRAEAERRCFQTANRRVRSIEAIQRLGLLVLGLGSMFELWEEMSDG